MEDINYSQTDCRFLHACEYMDYKYIASYMMQASLNIYESQHREKKLLLSC